MACITNFNASSLLFRSGAKPPSSPTFVPNFRAFSTPFKAWNTSVPMRRPSVKLEAPTGITMNSWTSTLLSACAPPLRMFIMGTGSVQALLPPTYRYNGRPASLAAALATANDTPKMALAPSCALLGVPSRLIITRSIMA